LLNQNNQASKHISGTCLFLKDAAQHSSATMVQVQPTQENHRYGIQNPSVLK